MLMYFSCIVSIGGLAEGLFDINLNLFIFGKEICIKPNKPEPKPNQKFGSGLGLDDSKTELKPNFQI